MTAKCILRAVHSYLELTFSLRGQGTWAHGGERENPQRPAYSRAILSYGQWAVGSGQLPGAPNEHRDPSSVPLTVSPFPPEA